MDKPETKKKNFFETLGGIITGITALIVAVTGFIAVINNSSCSKTKASINDTSSKVVIEQSSSAPTTQQINQRDKAIIRNKISSFNLNPHKNSFVLSFRSDLLDTSFIFKYSKEISAEELKISLINHFDFDSRARQKMNVYQYKVDDPIIAFLWTISINDVPIEDNNQFKKRIKENDVVSLSYQPIHQSQAAQTVKDSDKVK
jgi:hypothetical protein